MGVPHFYISVKNFLHLFKIYFFVFLFLSNPLNYKWIIAKYISVNKAMQIEDIIVYLFCFTPFVILIGVSMWLAWKDKDKFD